AALEGNLVRVGGDGTVRDRPQAVGEGVGAGEDRQHARELLGRAPVDVHDAGVGVGRPHHRRVRLTRHVHVVAVAPAPGDQAPVFLASHGLAEAVARVTRARLQERHLASSWPSRGLGAGRSQSPTPGLCQAQSRIRGRGGGDMTFRHVMWLRIAAVAVVTMLSGVVVVTASADETCNSPYVSKIIKGQEDYVYVCALGV